MSGHPVEDLNLNDPVHVQVGSSDTQLEGIVAFLGPVKFTEGSDWVGVRLTGQSVGKGKNDGVVQGVKYFDVAGENGGVFVKSKSVTKRTLTRLEELRLKRELKQHIGAGSSASVKTPTSIRTRSPIPSSSRSDKGSTPATTEKTRRRLEELREKRAAAASTGPASASVQHRTPASSRRAASSIGKTSTTSRGDQNSGVSGSSTRAESNSSPTRSATTSSGLSSSPAARLEAMKVKASNVSDSSSNATTVAKQYAILLEKYEDLEKENKVLKDDVNRAEEAVSNATIKINDQLQNINELQNSQSSVDVNDLDAQNLELKVKLENLEKEKREFASEKEAAESNFQKCMDKLQSTEEELNEERQSRHDEQSDYTKKLEQLSSEVAVLKSQAAATADQAASRANSDAESYKEKAKMQAESASLKRRIKDLETDLQDSETALEELTLDKEQLLEERDALEEKLEELNLDLEASRLEVEEVRVDLEEANAQKSGFGGTLSIADEMNSIGGSDPNTDEIVKSLSIQNSRLREALLRLREQSNIEKSDLTSKLRVAEKEAGIGRQISGEVGSLRSKKESLEEENRELKESIDVNSAFEGMIEDLSDKIIVLEDENAALRQSINELEEAAELATEMEEVQGEEVKALNRELENRVVKIINLEEAIKMQRKREEDFENTISNYRSSVKTLKEEKETLISSIQDESGEKSQLVQASQKAMAQAATLVDNAAKMKKMEMVSDLNSFKAYSADLRAKRLEEFMPVEIYYDISAVKVEILLSEVAEKANFALNHIQSIFDSYLHENDASSAGSHHSLSVEDLILHANAVVVIGKVGFIAQRLLYHLLLSNSNNDNELHDLSQIIQSFTLCNSDLTGILQMLVEENLMDSSVSSMREHLGLAEKIAKADDMEVMPGTEEGESSLISKIISRANVALFIAFSRTEEAKDISISSLQDKSVSIVTTIDSSTKSVTSEVSVKIEEMLKRISNELVSKSNFADEGKIEEIKALADSVLNEIISRNSPNEMSVNVKIGLDLVQSTKFSWSKFIKCMRRIYPDSELSYEQRASSTRDKLTNALDSESKLDELQIKLDEARSKLSSRSMELSMQSKRINELDALLKKKGAVKEKVQEENVSSVTLELKDKENKMLTEAMEVLQAQVDEYEAQIRAYKDQPKTRSPAKRTSRRPVAALNMDELFESNINLETNLFRPALRDALNEAAHWRGVSFNEAMSSLPPLPVFEVPSSTNTQNSFVAQPQEGNSTESVSIDGTYSDLSRCALELSIASASLRHVKAGVKCIDLSKRNVRSSLREKKMAMVNASRRFEAACGEATSRITQAVGGRPMHLRLA